MIKTLKTMDSVIPEEVYGESKPLVEQLFKYLDFYNEYLAKVSRDKLDPTVELVGTGLCNACGICVNLAMRIHALEKKVDTNQK